MPFELLNQCGVSLSIVRLLAAVILSGERTLAPVLALVESERGLGVVEAEAGQKSREVSGVEGSTTVEARSSES